MQPNRTIAPPSVRARANAAFQNPTTQLEEYRTISLILPGIDAHEWQSA